MEPNNFVLFQHILFLQDFLENRPPCPRAENYELFEIQEELEARGLSTEGTREDLNMRYLQSDTSKYHYNPKYWDTL